MRSWLQDPDGDGTYSFSTIDIPAGSYSVSVDASGPVAFTVEEGLATTISYQVASKALTVDTFAPDFGPDLSTVTGLVAHPGGAVVEPARRAWRLDVRSTGVLRLAGHGRRDGRRLLPAADARPRGLSPALAAQYPDLAGDEVLRLSRKDAGMRAPSPVPAGRRGRLRRAGPRCAGHRGHGGRPDPVRGLGAARLSGRPPRRCR